MAVKGSSFEDIQAQANQLLRVWAENPKLALGDLTKEQFSDTVTAFTSGRTEVERTRSGGPGSWARSSSTTPHPSGSR